MYCVLFLFVNLNKHIVSVCSRVIIVLRCKDNFFYVKKSDLCKIKRKKTFCFIVLDYTVYLLKLRNGILNGKFILIS